MVPAAPHGSLVPTNLAAVLDKGAVDGLAVPAGGDVLIAEELGLRRHSLLVAESQVAAALVDRASIGTIAIALPGALQVRTPMPGTAAPPTSLVSEKNGPLAEMEQSLVRSPWAHHGPRNPCPPLMGN